VGRHMFRTLKSNNEFWRAAQASIIVVMAITCGLIPQSSRADQGGIGFWLPGTFGSLAATPLEPGLSMSVLYLHSFVSAGGDVAASRTIGFPNRPVNLSVDLNAQIKGTADVVAFRPARIPDLHTRSGAQDFSETGSLFLDWAHSPLLPSACSGPSTNWGQSFGRTP
jgi:hypothetical protein